MNKVLSIHIPSLPLLGAKVSSGFQAGLLH
jgi:hypothetical protein